MKKLFNYSLLITLLFILTACGQSNRVRNFELLDVTHDNEIIAYVSNNAWQGEIATLRTRQTLTLSALITLNNGNVIDLEETNTIYTISATIKSGANNDILTIDNLGNQIILTAENQGITEIVFHYLIDDEIKYSSPSIPVLVYNAPLEQDVDVLAFEILNVDDSLNRLAYVHGSHWHGSVRINASQTLNVTTFIMDESQTEIILDPSGLPNAIRATLAPSANQNIISIVNNKDTIQITGLQTGSTQVVFEWLKDGEVYYTAPPITIRVD